MTDIIILGKDGRVRLCAYRRDGLDAVVVVDPRGSLHRFRYSADAVNRNIRLVEDFLRGRR